MDPRIQVNKEDMDVWYREARKIEHTECTIRGAAARVRSLDTQLAEFENSASDASLKTAAAAARKELRPILLGFVGDPRDPGHVNLSGRINWLTIQVGNYSGRPTAAQMAWITTFRDQTEQYDTQLAGFVAGSLASLNAKLRAAHLREIGS